MMRKLISVFLFSIAAIIAVGAQAQPPEKSKEEKLLQVIRAAATNQATELDLSNFYVTELPQELWQLSQLKWLDLSGTAISSLPPEIGQLDHLERLDLNSTLLRSLPPEIGQLSNLVALDLSETSISSLPPEIGQLSNLIELDLSKTSLSDLPPEIAQLKNLDRLNLSGTRLTEVPPEIYQLPNLRTLSINATPIRDIPRDLLLKPNLTVNYDKRLYADRVQIVWFFYNMTYERLNRLEVVVLDFNNSQTEIYLEMLCACGDATHEDFFRNYLAAGLPIDIVGPMSYGQNNRLAGEWVDLQPFVEASGYDLSIFPAPLIDSLWTADGLIGLPSQVYPGLLYYNADLFDAAGLNYPPTVAGAPYIMPDGSAVPWDYDTITRIGPLLTLDADGHNGTSPDFDPDQIVQFGFVHQWDNLKSDFNTFGGGSLLDDTGQVVMPDNWRAQAHWMWDSLWRYYFMPNDTHTQNDLQGNPFASGKVAMARTMSWYTCCLADLTAHWDLAIPPAYEDTIYAPNDAESFFMTRASQHQAEAFMVLQYFSHEGAWELSEIFNSFPALPEAQPAAIERLSQQYPDVKNWDVLTASIPLAPIPHHDAGYPNDLEGQQRLAEFLTLLRSEQGASLNLDAEINKLVADLQMIVNQ